MKIGAKLIQVEPISSQRKGRTGVSGVVVAMAPLAGLELFKQVEIIYSTALSEEREIGRNEKFLLILINKKIAMIPSAELNQIRLIYK